MARITADQAAAKWQSRLSASTQQIQDGVNAVTVAPGQKAAAQKNYWVQAVTASADKWARNVGSVTLQDWQTAMIQKGIPRISQGAAANVGKVQAFMSDFLNYLDAGKAKIAAMPKGDLNTNIARAVAQITYNAQYKRNR